MKEDRKSPHSTNRNEKKRALIEARNTAIRSAYEELKAEKPNMRAQWYYTKLEKMFYLESLTIRNILYGFNYHDKPKATQGALFVQSQA